MSPFLGTRALVASRRPWRRGLVIVFAVAGLIFGLGAALTAADREGLFVLQAAACLFAGCVGALQSGGNLTMGLGGLAAPSRREELSLLPVGRLALPAAVLLATARLTLSTWLGWSAPFLLASAPCHSGELTLQLLLGGLGVATAAALALAAPIAIGSSSSGALLCLYVLGPGLAVTLGGMGHGPEAVALFGGLCVGALVLLCLGLPFAVHALGPAAIQTARGVPTRDAAEEGLAAIGALVAAGSFLAGGSPALLVAGGGLLAWGARRLVRLPRPARRRWRASPVAIGLMAALFVPIGAAAWALDIRAQALADAGEGLVARTHREAVVVDPTGRRAAVMAEARYGLGFGARRLVVVELTGPGAGRRTVVPARFPRLEPGAWSADGRWLAVQDDAAGRFEGPATGGGLELPDGTAGVAALGLFGGLRGTTLLVDADGAVSDLGRRAVAPGWTGPEELVEVVFGLDGKARLRRGAEVERLQRGWELEGYLGGRAVVATAGASGEDARFGEVRGPLLRWTDGAAFAPLALEPPPWRLEAEEAAVASYSPSSVTLVRGDAPQARVTLEDAAVERTSLGAGSLLAVAEAGLVRVALPSGARTLLVPGVEALDALDGPSRAHAARTPSGWWLLVGDAAPRRLTLPAGSVPRALAADGRVVVVGGVPALVDAEGRATPLLP